MKAKHRKILVEVMDYCNKLGGVLDGTSTSIDKYKDRQKAHLDIYKILLAILSDHPENEQSEYEFELAAKHLEVLKKLTEKQYPDRKGNY